VSFREDPLEDFAPDEAEELWGGGPAELRDAKVRHIPFYKFTYYADRLDLRHAGYELEKFEQLFDLLDEARVSQAQKVNRLLHLPSGREGNPIWQPRRAREIEFRVIESLHQFGLSIVPNRLRKVLGRAFNDGEMSAFDVDLIDVFYWASLAQVARDFIWRDQRLEAWAEYLEYPVRRAFGANAVAA
jgi:hypothetical protein